MSFQNSLNQLQRFSPLAYILLRIVSGLAFSFHGMQKILGWYSSYQPELGSQLWIGGWIELVTGVLIALGLLFRPSALLASGTMLVAYVQFHWKLAFAEGGWLPAINQGELALLYCVLFLYLALQGPSLLAQPRSNSES